MKYDTENLWQIIHKHGWIWSEMLSSLLMLLLLYWRQRRLTVHVSKQCWSPYNLIFSNNYESGQRQLFQVEK